jgi:hypothetical protein
MILGIGIKDAAELLGIDQPKISALHKGKLSGFSLERLFKFLNILGQDIIIKVATSKMRTKKKPCLIVNLEGINEKSINNTNKAVTGAAMLAKKMDAQVTKKVNKKTLKAIKDAESGKGLIKGKRLKN